MVIKNRVRFSSTMDKELAQKLDELADSSKIPKSKLVDMAIQMLLEKYKLDSKREENKKLT